VGVKDGTGLDEVFLDFTAENIPNIIMFFGRNGSGKTTILSQLHPGSGSYDDREDLILEGKEGEKIFKMKDGDDTYECRHIYGTDRKVKSFFTKNGTELNNSGGVRNFAALAEEHLEFTPDFFKVGKIGSNITNFVDMTSSERKKYIAKFLPDVDPWLQASKIVSKKFTGLRKTITFLSDELGKIDTVDNLTSTQSSSANALEAARQRVTDASDAVAVAESKLNDLPEWVATGNPHKKDLADASESLEDAESVKSGYEAQYPSLSNATPEAIAEKLENYNIELGELSNIVSTSETEEVSLKERVTALKGQVERKKEELKTVKKSSREVDKIQEMIDEAQISLNEAKNDLKQYPLPPEADSITIGQLSAAKGTVWSAYETVRASLSEVSTDVINALLEQLESDKSIEDTLRRLQASSNRTLQRLRETTDSKKSMVNLLKNQAEQAKNLDKRPKDCKSTSCPFIASAVRFKDAPIQLIENQKLVKIAEGDETEAKEYLESVNQALTLAQTFRVVYDTLLAEPNVKAYPIAPYLENFPEFCSVMSEDVNGLAKIFDVNTIMRSVQARETYANMTESIENLKLRLVAAQSSDTFASSLETDVTTLEEEITTLTDSIDELVENRSASAAKATKLRKKKEILSDLKNASDTIVTLQASLDSKKAEFTACETILTNAKKLAVEITQLREALEERQNELSPLQKIYDDARLKLARREEYETQLVTINESFQVVKDVKDALDPVKGIPTLLVGEYLRDIESAANSLLDVAYGGTFRIGFNITNSDFFIEVYKENGGFCKDVKLASAGQIAMIKTSLSLSIFKSALGRFNILCLDEIDSTLDESNRRLFLEILERQIVELGLEQLFCISHNDSFDAARIGLILLPGHTIDIGDQSLMAGKAVIANFSHQEGDGNG
jgi:DNA repair exonuclease SbcCD ATPase subunit